MAIGVMLSGLAVVVFGLLIAFTAGDAIAAAT